MEERAPLTEEITIEIDDRFIWDLLGYALPFNIVQSAQEAENRYELPEHKYLLQGSENESIQNHDLKNALFSQTCFFNELYWANQTNPLYVITAISWKSQSITVIVLPHWQTFDEHYREKIADSGT